VGEPWFRRVFLEAYEPSAVSVVFSPFLSDGLLGGVSQILRSLLRVGVSVIRQRETSVVLGGCLE